MDVYCKFCGGKAFLVSNSPADNYYRCPICGASRVCTKKGAIIKKYPWRTPKQLTLAELAHSYIDQLCFSPKGKSELYSELSRALKISPKKCHFKTMSINEMSVACELFRKWIKENRNFF